jgi:Flp pilus assembly protein TadD
MFFLKKIAALYVSAWAVVGLVGCALPMTDAQAVKALCDSPALKLDSYSQRSLLGAGYKAMESSQLECAERLLRLAQTMDPKDPYAPLNLGVVYQRTGRHEMARAAYAQVMRLAPAEISSQIEPAVAATQKLVLDRQMSLGEMARHNLALLP